MSDPLHPAIAHYFEASQARDATAMARRFTADGVVRDEDQSHRGHDAIAGWAADTHARYAMTSEVVASRAKGSVWVVTARVTGQFPGSPLDFTYRFTVAGDQISALEISL